jgi:AcrR family transcriptional regulator
MLMVDNRARILDAAARVYAEYGYRGATTRRIAVAAGVNEVTLFRTFGSKAALIDEAVRCSAASAGAGRATLPVDPVDPEHELTEWAAALLHRLRETRSLMRKSMSEVEERPEAACAAHVVAGDAAELRTYMRRLAAAGYVEWDRPRGKARTCCRCGGAPRARRRGRAGRREDAHAAGTMLIAALFADAMGRDMMPGMYPEPADRAPELYVRLFLRAVRCAQSPRRRVRHTTRQARS